MIRRLAAVVVAVAIAVSAGPALGDIAVEQLRQSPVYVNSAVTHSATADAVARLTAVADELRAAGRPVRIAVVPGPSGAPSMRGYAARLRRALGFDGAVIAVAPGRAVGAVGPRTEAAITTSLRAAQVGSITDLVERASAAARAAAGPPLAPSRSDMVRAVLALIGIALVGGVWAGAFGIRRANRQAREALDDRSALVRVRLDAVGARLDVLATLPTHHARADDRLDAATRVARRAQSELDQATAPDDVPPAEALVNDACVLTRDAEAAAGVPAPLDPFDGLCRVDPAHGPASGTGHLDPDGPSLDLCVPCLKRVRDGHPPHRRMVPVHGHDVPFDQA